MNRADPRANIRYSRTEIMQRVRNGTLLVQPMNRGELVECMRTTSDILLWIIYSCILILSDFRQHHPRSPIDFENQNGLRSSLVSLCKLMRAEMHCPKTQEDRKGHNPCILVFSSSLVDTGVLGHHPNRIQLERLLSSTFQLAWSGTFAWHHRHSLYATLMDYCIV